MDNYKEGIVPFLPGYLESYDLAPSGKVTLRRSAQFHSIERKPKWSDIPLAIQPHGISKSRRLFRVYYIWRVDVGGCIFGLLWTVLERDI